MRSIPFGLSCSRFSSAVAPMAKASVIVSSAISFFIVITSPGRFSVRLIPKFFCKDAGISRNVAFSLQDAVNPCGNKVLSTASSGLGYAAPPHASSKPSGRQASRATRAVLAPRCLSGLPFSPFAEAFDQKVEHGNEEQIQDGAHDHAAEDCGADRTASVLAGAAGHNQRDHAENESKRCHENRAKTDARGFDGSIDNRQTAFPQLLGKF